MKTLKIFKNNYEKVVCKKCKKVVFKNAIAIYRKTIEYSNSLPPEGLVIKREYVCKFCAVEE